jgi:hypothetical protein
MLLGECARPIHKTADLCSLCRTKREAFAELILRTWVYLQIGRKIKACGWFEMNSSDWLLPRMGSLKAARSEGLIEFTAGRCGGLEMPSQTALALGDLVRFDKLAVDAVVT